MFIRPRVELDAEEEIGKEFVASLNFGLLAD